MQLPVSIKEPQCSYTVKVKTGDDFGAGTDSDVLCAIFGKKDGKVHATLSCWAHSPFTLVGFWFCFVVGVLRTGMCGSSLGPQQTEAAYI